MKGIYLAILCLITASASGQRIIKNIGDLATTPRRENIKSIRTQVYTGNLIIKLKDGSKEVVKPEGIWGYEDEDQNLYRFFIDDYFLVKSNGPICIYYAQRDKDKMRAPKYFFSQDLTADMYDLNKKNLEKVYNGNDCFVNEVKKNFHFMSDYAKYNKKEDRFKVNALFEQCTSDKAYGNAF